MKSTHRRLPVRPDRPHVFVTQKRAPCSQGDGTHEVRTVLREQQTVELTRCSTCGCSERPVGLDASTYLQDLLERAPDPAVGGVFKHTTSTCPHCLELVDAEVVIADRKVYFHKQCHRCGPSRALVSEDARYYIDAYRYARAGSQPLQSFNQAERGCPRDCGLCTDHEQHTCLPVVEVTDHCDLACPICLVDNTANHHISLDAFTAIRDRLLQAEGQLESIALSGGEPSCHPQILELIDIATHENIGRVVLLTNGLRIARDPAFAEQLAARGAYVSLQFDGYSAEVYRVLRGRDLLEQKLTALATLERLAIPTQLIFTAARGVNEDQLGKVVELWLSKEHILSLNVQPVAFTGRGGGSMAGDPLNRLTIPGVLQAIESQTDAALRVADFFPLPCPNPHCVALSYVLRLNDGTHVPFPRFADLNKYGSLLRNSATLPALPEIEQTLQDVAYDLFARQDHVPQAKAILAAMRRTIRQMFPDRPLTAKEILRVGEGQAKSIFVHHYMDPHDFDLERLRKCCHHYPQVDGRVMPMCGFNLFHRGAAKGPGTTTASWGVGPWQERS